MRIIVILLLACSWMFGDTVKLKDGRTINGTFLGGDARTIRVALGDTVETFSVSDVSNISFGSMAQPMAPPILVDPVPAAASSKRPAVASSSRVSVVGSEIPNGAVLSVRMIDDVDSERDKVGNVYRASLDEPVMDTAGKTVVARGADVVVKLVDDKESGKIQGRTVLTLDIVSLMINGRHVDIDTTAITQESESRTSRSGYVIGGTAALGAIIGAIAGGGRGAAIGAASGAGAGTAVQVMTKGQRVRIPSETRLTFTLQQAVKL